MTTKESVEAFLAQRRLAVVGVSTTGKKFGNMAYRELRGMGYELYPIHPRAERVEGDRCFQSFDDLPEGVEAALIVVPPAQTEQVVADAARAGVKHIWMQQGAESQEAVQSCEENGIDVIQRECILMYAQPMALYHRPHRWLWGLLGKLAS